MCRIISFVSAKGGVGKTSIIYNISKYISNTDYKVCVFDTYFSMNHVSNLFEKSDNYDLKEYITGRLGTINVLNKYSENLYYIKTNSLTFDYLKHISLIKFFISEISLLFDFIFIDVNSFSSVVLSAMLESSNEVIIITLDDENCIRNSAKLISVIKSFPNICDFKLVINKARVIHSLFKKSLNEKDVSDILKMDVFFSIPKFYKNNYLKNKRALYIKQNYIKELSYSIITNKKAYIDNYKKYKGAVGLIKRLRYLKYE